MGGVSRTVVGWKPLPTFISGGKPNVGIKLPSEDERVSPISPALLRGWEKNYFCGLPA